MNQPLPFQEGAELFRWGPIPGKFFFDADFLPPIFVECPKVFQCTWPATLFLFKEGRMVWINELEPIQQLGEEVFQRLMLPEEKRQSIWDQWQKSLIELKETEEQVASLDLTALTDTELAGTWQHFFEVMDKFWLYTIPAEFGNYGSDVLLKRELTRVLNLEEREVLQLMETLTAPENPSFYQEEEIALAETTNLLDHQQRFAWLKNSYAGTQVLPVDFFAERKKNLNPHIRQEIEAHAEEVRQKKQAMVEKYNLPERIVTIATTLRIGVEWQDQRKKYIFIALHYKTPLMEEIGRRKNLSLEELQNWAPWEILDLMQGGNKHPQPGERLQPFGVLLTPEMTMLDAEQTLQYWEMYAEEHVAANTTEARGIIASASGKPVRGKVHILLDPHNLEVFQEGEILVVPMTSPEYVFAMKKSAAIVTDNGGLMSHAAIVSRELKKPCIVGTKIATRIFKDGDIVEVDTLAGTVRKVYTEGHAE